MRTIAILNLKGGVGKTVTSVNFAAIIASDHKQRVLLVDADSQCNATEFFGGDPEKGNLANILRTGYAEESCFLEIQHTDKERLDLLAADDALMDYDLSKIENNEVDSAALKRVCENLAFTDSYDYVIIDCPPAFNAASTAALIAADEVIVPIKLDAFSLRGMANLMRQIANMRRINKGLKLAGILPTMYYADPAIIAALVQLRASKLPVFDTVIRRSGKVDAMTFAQEPITEFSPRSAAGVDYRRFVREYMEGGKSNG